MLPQEERTTWCSAKWILRICLRAASSIGFDANVWVHCTTARGEVADGDWCIRRVHESSRRPGGRASRSRPYVPTRSWRRFCFSYERCAHETRAANFYCTSCAADAAMDSCGGLRVRVVDLPAADGRTPTACSNDRQRTYRPLTPEARRCFPDAQCCVDIIRRFGVGLWQVEGIDPCTHAQNDCLGPGWPESSPIATGWAFQGSHFSIHNFFLARSHACSAKSNDQAVDAFVIPYRVGDLRLFKTEGIFDSLRDPDKQIKASLAATPEWQACGGCRHVLFLSRSAIELIKHVKLDGSMFTLRDPFWHNVTKLLIEPSALDCVSSPGTCVEIPNSFGVPYSTFLHPPSEAATADWQDFVRRKERRHVLSFVGGRHRTISARHPRTALISRCSAAGNVSSNPCHLVDCDNPKTRCDRPRIVDVLLNSTFCLEPPGDWPTRAGFFDALVSGCIPVVFPHMSGGMLGKGASYQKYYSWYLPARIFASVVLEAESFDDAITRTHDMAANEISARQEAIAQLIPSLVYVSPSSAHDRVDATSVAFRNVKRHLEAAPFRDRWTAQAPVFTISRVGPIRENLLNVIINLSKHHNPLTQSNPVSTRTITSTPP